MAKSMIGVVAFCLVVNISGFHMPDQPTASRIEGKVILETAVDVTQDQDIHTDAYVAPRENRFNKTTGKKLKTKFKSKPGDWKPKNNITVTPTIPPESPEDKEARLFAEFDAAWKRRKDNRVFLSTELDGLDTFYEKVNRARDWVEMKDVIDALGEVGQQTFRQNPELMDDIMVPEKPERQAAAKKFLKLSAKVKDNVLSEKMRLHAQFMRTSHRDWFDSWQDSNEDKARRLSEYDESVKRRQMRGVPRRPMGDGEDLPSPNSKDL